MTESGKSQLAKELFLSARAPRLIIDPADSSITASACGSDREDIAAATFRDPLRPPDVATARFVPNDPEDQDAINAVFKWAFNNFPRYVWIDEADMVAPVQGCAPWLRTYVVQGRKRMLGLITCNQRPRDLYKGCITQAAHTFIFALGDHDDRDYVAKKIGIGVDVLTNELAALPRFGFLHFDLRAQTLTVCPPLAIR